MQLHRSLVLSCCNFTESFKRSAAADTSLAESQLTVIEKTPLAQVGQLFYSHESTILQLA
jgi:hypothetical protein